MSKFDLRSRLESQFPQLTKKQQLIEYYMDFQFPQKQMKLAEWWEKVLGVYLAQNKKLTITLNQVQEFFSFHNMKPLPLKNLLVFYIKKNVFDWAQKRQQPEPASMWSSMTRWFKKSTQNEENVVACRPNDKIYYTQAKKQKLKEANFMLPALFAQQAVISYQFVLQKLGHSIGLAEDVQLILAEFYEMGVLMKDKIEQSDVLIYSKQKNLQNSNWVVTSKTKYLINSKLEFFENRIAKRCQEYDNQLNKAKQCLRNNDKISAQRLVQSCKNIKGNLKNYQTRMGALRNNLNQVELNEMDNTTVDMLMKTQDIIKKTMVDVDKLETIKQVNEDISANQSQINLQFQEMSKHLENQEEADQLFKQLTQQMNQQKLHLIKSGVKNISLSLPAANKQKPQKMQIENDRQYIFN